MLDIFCVRFRTGPDAPWQVDEWADTRSDARHRRWEVLKEDGWGHKNVSVKRIVVDPTATGIVKLLNSMHTKLLEPARPRVSTASK